MQRFALQLKLTRNNFSVKMTNFGPNEQSTNGKRIGNEASRKYGFGNSDPPLMIWLSGRLASWLALLLQLGNTLSQADLGQTFALNFCTYVREGELNSVLINNYSDSP